jgi:hypothetical protein
LRQLDVLLIDHTFANFRIQSINRDKFLLDAQRRFPRYSVDYFLNENPFWLKTEIMWRAFTVNPTQILRGEIIPSDWLRDANKRLSSVFKNLVNYQDDKLKTELETILESLYIEAYETITAELNHCYISDRDCSNCTVRQSQNALASELCKLFVDRDNPDAAGILPRIQETLTAICIYSKENLGFTKINDLLKKMIDVLVGLKYTEENPEMDNRKELLYSDALINEQLAYLQRIQNCDNKHVKNLLSGWYEKLKNVNCNQPIIKTKEKVISRVKNVYVPLLMLYAVEYMLCLYIKNKPERLMLDQPAWDNWAVMKDSISDWIISKAINQVSLGAGINPRKPYEGVVWYMYLIEDMVRRFFDRPVFAYICPKPELLIKNDSLSKEDAYGLLFMHAKANGKKNKAEYERFRDCVGMYLQHKWYADSECPEFPDYYTDLALFYYLERKATRVMSTARSKLDFNASL